MFSGWTWLPEVNGVSTCLFWNVSCPMEKCALTKFSDDPKLGGSGNILRCRAASHRDRDSLEEWHNRKLMKFDHNKCQILHITEGRGPCSDVGQNSLSLVKRWLWGHTLTQEKPPSPHWEVAGHGDELFFIIIGGRIRDSHH